MTSRLRPWTVVIVIVSVMTIVIALPVEWKRWAPPFIQNFDFHFGLDLAGGTQLDFRISEDEIREQINSIDRNIALLEEEGSMPGERLLTLQTQRQAIIDQSQHLVEAIRMVLERRINALGVSEATITPSYVGDEQHLLVECPGVVDTQICIDTVGKTIQLEFKEEFTESTEEFEDSIRSRVQDVIGALNKGEKLVNVGEDLGDELGIAFQNERPYFKDQLPKGLEPLWNKEPSRVERFDGEVNVREQDQNDEMMEKSVPGIFLAEITKPKSQTGRTIVEASVAFDLLVTQESHVKHHTHKNTPLDMSSIAPFASSIREMQPGELRVVPGGDDTASLLFLRSYVPSLEEMTASHILVSYKGASAGDATVQRTKDQALLRAQEIKKQLDKGTPFEELARRESDGPSAKDGGSLGTFGRGTMVPAFEQAILALIPGQISDPTETQFGFHLIRLDRPISPSRETASLEELSVSGTDALSRASSFLSRLQRGQITRTEDIVYVRTLFFSLLPTGWKDTPLDGKHFRAATVTLDSVTNIPVVQIMFDDEGGRIFQELTKRNVGKRIAIFVGGELVSAPVVQQEIAGGTAIITGNNSFDDARRLAQDLNTGAIPAPIHLSGQRTVEATLGAESLRTSLEAALLGSLILVIYLLVVYRFLGFLASIALGIYALLFWVLLKLPLFFFSSEYIVLTLAGMAGVILSLGMAVDANVLVFERFKEEIRKGKLFKTAVETAFDRAWPSIRDSNLSTILTCIILFTMGTSIVRGFAVTLGIGVVISMFTAITVTRWMLRTIATTDLPNRPWLWVTKRND